MWTEAFKTALRDDNYAASYKLFVGSKAVHAAPQGKWDNSTKVIEICSHDDRIIGDYSGVEYRSIQGLVSFSMGTRGVNLRTCEPQLASLRVTVTNDAASMLVSTPNGVLARLSCNINGSGYNTVFLGMYQGMEWTGGATTDLIFVEVLGALQTRATEQETQGYVSGADGTAGHYSWFQGCGKEYSTRTPWDPTSSTTISLTDGTGLGGAADVSTKSALPNVYKYGDSFNPKAADLVYSAPFYGGNGGLFALVTPTAGKQVCVEYDSVSVGSTFASLLNTVNSKAFGYDLPSRTGNTFGTGSKVKVVCGLYGSPVSEIVNLFYLQGYYPSMGGGLFGGRATAMASPYIDFDDIRRKAAAFDYLYRAAAGSDAVDGPFRHLVTAQVRDGFSYLNKLFGKWGCFPTFRQGGYTVGMMLDHFDYPRTNVPFRYNIAEKYIVSAQWQSTDPQAKVIYKQLSYSSDDTNTSPSTAYDAINVQPSSMPCMAELKVKTSPVAPGSSVAPGFIAFHKKYLLDWYTDKPPSRATVVLSGLHWANLACGDIVTFDMPQFNIHTNSAHTRYFGPMKSSGANDVVSVLGSYGGTSEGDLDMTGRTTWYVVGVAPQWMGSTVTIEIANCSRLGPAHHELGTS